MARTYNTDVYTGGMTNPVIDYSGILITQVYADSLTVTYVCRAKPGTSLSAPLWNIMKIDSSGSQVSVRYANGDPFIFDQLPANRANYIYA